MTPGRVSTKGYRGPTGRHQTCLCVRRGLTWAGHNRSFRKGDSSHCRNTSTNSLGLCRGRVQVEICDSGPLPLTSERDPGDCTGCLWGRRVEPNHPFVDGGETDLRRSTWRGVGGTGRMDDHVRTLRSRGDTSDKKGLRTPDDPSTGIGSRKHYVLTSLVRCAPPLLSVATSVDSVAPFPRFSEDSSLKDSTQNLSHSLRSPSPTPYRPSLPCVHSPPAGPLPRRLWASGLSPRLEG